MKAAAVPNYSFDLPLNQNFSLPSSIISYISEFPSSPKGYQKLQKTCKYFFSKIKIIFVEEKVLYSRDEFSLVSGKKLPMRNNIKYSITELGSLWDDCFSKIRSYIYKLNLTSLSLTSQTLYLDDINFLLTNDKMEKLYLYEDTIQDEGGTPISIFYILNKVPYLTDFTYFNKCEVYSNLSLNKLNSVKRFNKLEWFYLVMYETSELIQAETLFKLIQNFADRFSKFRFYFKRNTHQTETLKEELQNFIANSFRFYGRPTFKIGEVE